MSHQDHTPDHHSPNAAVERTLAAMIFESVRAHRDRDAILSPGRIALTYADLGDQIHATARALAQAGYGREARIGIALPQSPECAVALIATGCVAAVAPLNRQLSEDTLAGLQRAMRLDALIVAEDDDSDALRAARRAGLPVLRLHALGDKHPAGTFELLAERGSAVLEQRPPTADDFALIAHTSGTTAGPKIVPFEQWRLTEHVWNRIRLQNLTAADRCLIAAPLHTTGAIRRSLLPPLFAGGSAIVASSLDATSLVDGMVAQRATYYAASPTMHIALLDEFDRRTPRPALALRLVISSFTALAADLRARLEQTFGVPVVIAYGMTETGTIAQTPLAANPGPPTSVGRPAVLEVAVADDDGRLLDAETVGEIQVRGPQVFRGYESNDEANRDAFREGWFRTGDIGRIDCNGFVYLHGRVKDIINRGGAKVVPSEVENVLTQWPDVVEAAVFPLPHPSLGEDVGAAIVLRGSKTLQEARLRRFARARLAAYQVPARILLLDRLPRSSLGKVDRVELARLMHARAEAEFALPVGDDETRLARIFAEVTEAPAVSRHDNFFEIGGDSLRGVRLLSLIEEQFGVSVDLDTLFDHPTVAGLAQAIAAEMAESQASPKR